MIAKIEIVLVFFSTALVDDCCLATDWLFGLAVFLVDI
jgi:hypothetical protein